MAAVREDDLEEFKRINRIMHSGAHWGEPGPYLTESFLMSVDQANDYFLEEDRLLARQKSGPVVGYYIPPDQMEEYCAALRNIVELEFSHVSAEDKRQFWLRLCWSALHNSMTHTPGPLLTRGILDAYCQLLTDCDHAISEVSAGFFRQLRLLTVLFYFIFIPYF